MPNAIPPSLKGLRIRLISRSEESTPIEKTAYAKLKRLLRDHGQNLTGQPRNLFRQSLSALLPHGLRARGIKSNPLEASPKASEIQFTASDGRSYAAPAEAWPRIQKADRARLKMQHLDG